MCTLRFCRAQPSARLRLARNDKNVWAGLTWQLPACWAHVAVSLVGHYFLCRHFRDWPHSRHLTRLCLQELLEKEVVKFDDLNRILGKRPFESSGLSNMDRFRGELTRGLPKWIAPAGVWEWIDSFRGPGLAVAGLGDLKDDGKDDDDDDDDEDDGKGGGGAKSTWKGWFRGKRYPVAT
jgi:hypothetical protein